MLGNVLTGHHETKTCRSEHQQQSLEEPMQADLPFTRLEAERTPVGREQQDPFCHAQAKLKQKEENEKCSTVMTHAFIQSSDLCNYIPMKPVAFVFHHTPFIIYKA